MSIVGKNYKETENNLDKAISNLGATYEPPPPDALVKIQQYQNELLKMNLEKLNSIVELNLKATEKLIEEQERTRKQAKIWSWTNGILSFLMIILAGVTIWYASIDSKTDDMLIEKQEKLLKEINLSINESNILLLQIKDTNKKKVQDISPEP